MRKKRIEVEEDVYDRLIGLKEVLKIDHNLDLKNISNVILILWDFFLETPLDKEKEIIEKIKEVINHD